MKDTDERFGYESLAFFGQVNASISHELKNVMAIISETAGLLGDLSDMASTGSPISPDMLKDCTANIMEEIQRGFAVIRQMNRFSHSIDHPVESVNLSEVVDLAIQLAHFLRFAGKAQVRSLNGPPPVVMTCPFLMLAIVYRTLVYTFKSTGVGANVSISVRTTHDEAGWKVIFSGFSVNEFEAFPDAFIKSMAVSIGVTIHCDPTADWLELVVPPAMDDRSLSNG